MSGKGGLLDELRDEMRCDFISDLQRVFRAGRFFGKLSRWMGDETHSLEEWTAAVRYITGCDRSFSSTWEAVRFLTSGPDGK